ncbi:MAG: TetR/AcrR family transcriptional regulator [Spirochaetes bacterium]|nr:TetR/AcrR family transcriptional regulator [Spirochaetota bacterium]
MQILKEEIKQNIIDSAIEEFYQYGYEKASMRKIAKRVGITVGNLYRYFPGKNDIFSQIVFPVYHRIEHWIRHHHDEISDEMIHSMELEELIVWGSEIISNLFSGNRKIFIILIDGSQGSEYESVKEKILEFQTIQMMEHMEGKYPPAKRHEMKALARSSSVAYIEGILDLIRSTEDEEQMIKNIKEFIIIMFSGLKIFI